LVDGQVAGNVLCWDDASRRMLAYWTGQTYSGLGDATRAPAVFLRQVETQPGICSPRSLLTSSPRSVCWGRAVSIACRSLTSVPSGPGSSTQSHWTCAHEHMRISALIRNDDCSASAPTSPPIPPASRRV